MTLIFIFFLLMWNYFSQTFALKWHASQKSQFFIRLSLLVLGNVKEQGCLLWDMSPFCSFLYLLTMSYLVLVSLRAIFLQYEALFSKGSWQGGFESSWELLSLLAPFPIDLTLILVEPLFLLLFFGLACSLLIEGYWLFWKQDMSFCFLAHLVQDALSFSQTLASCRSCGYWLFIPIRWCFSICGDILLPSVIVWVWSLVFTCWKFDLQRPMLIKIEIRTFGKQLGI